jgi:tetratricopeptide (TPR) repeat protein
MRAGRSPMMTRTGEAAASTSSRSERMKATNEGSISGRRRVLALASLFVVWLVPALAATAHADALDKPTNVVAREHLAAGNRYYHLGEFEKAVEEYKAGSTREDAPVFSFNLGQCYRKLNRYDDAIRHYERFLDRGKPTGEVEASVRKFIAQMKAEREKAERERAAMQQPPVAPAPPLPASSAAPGQTLSVSQPPPERPHGMPMQRKLAVGLAVASIAAGGLGVVLGLRAESYEADAYAICPMSTCDRAEEANLLIDRGKASALHANVAFGVAGAALLGTAVLWFTGAPNERRSTVLVPRVSRSFAGVAAIMEF